MSIKLKKASAIQVTLQDGSSDQMWRISCSDVWKPMNMTEKEWQYPPSQSSTAVDL